MTTTTKPALSPAFDLPPGIAIEATDCGMWRGCAVSGVVLRFDHLCSIVPKRTDVRVLCDAGQEQAALDIAVKLRRMGWAKCRPEVRVA